MATVRSGGRVLGSGPEAVGRPAAEGEPLRLPDQDTAREDPSFAGGAQRALRLIPNCNPQSLLCSRVLLRWDQIIMNVYVFFIMAVRQITGTTVSQ